MARTTNNGRLDQARAALEMAGTVSRFAATIVKLTLIWAEAWSLALAIAAGAIIHASGDGLIALAVPPALWGSAVLLIFKRSYWRAIAKNVHDSISLRYTARHRIRAVLDDCKLTSLDSKGNKTYPDCVVTVGPLLPWRKMTATALRKPAKGNPNGDEFQATHKNGGLRSALRPAWLEYNLMPAPTQIGNSFRSAAETSLRQLHDYPGVGSRPIDNRIVVRLSIDDDPYTLTIVTSDSDNGDDGGDGSGDTESWAS